MKRLLITLILTFLFAGNIYSQDSSKSNEIGVYFTSTNKFGLRFKFGSENMMFRVTALSLYYHNSELESQEVYDESHYTGFGLGFGLEVPVSITKNFEFLYGGELMLVYSYWESHYNRENHSKDKNYEWSAGVILGFAYKINQDFIVSAELIPKFFYQYGETSSSNLKSYGFKLDTKSAGLTVGYRF